MPPRLPASTDFPTTLKFSIINPPSGKDPANVVIFLHGLGDNEGSFSRFARALNLPETVCISIQGPKTLMIDLEGFHWGDDILIDQGSGDIEYDAGFVETTNLLSNDIVRNALIDKCGFKERQILFFGFGQGGMAAFAAVSSLESRGLSALGGMISIGGSLPRTSQGTSGQYKTPVLIIGGSSPTLVTDEAVTRIKKTFTSVEYRRWPTPGDKMPSNSTETLPIMQFFARRLQSYSGVPKGSVELAQ